MDISMDIHIHGKPGFGEFKVIQGHRRWHV